MNRKTNNSYHMDKDLPGVTSISSLISSKQGVSELMASM